MRLTAYITVSGERTLTRLLQPGLVNVRDCSPDGKFDEIAARKALANVPGITPASDDSRPVYAFALQAIDYAHGILEQLAERKDNSASPSCRNDERCEANMDRNKCAYANLDIAWRSGGIRARVFGDNPKELVGRTDQEVFETCVFWAYVCLLIKRSISAKVEIVEGRNAEGAIARAEAHLLDRELYRKGETCDRRKGGLCSPIDTTCGNYDCGRCKWRPKS